MNKEQVFSCDWLGRPLTIKTGKLALQATASVTVQYGETVVLATVVEEKNEEKEGTDFFPLMVDLEERLYAAGMIKGSQWVKRDGRPTDESVLIGRMIDRSIRPLFNQESRNPVQVVMTVMAVDKENDHDIVSLVAAAVVLAISGIEWNGPLCGIRVGRVNNKLVFNPTYKEQEQSDLDLVVSGTEKKVVMIEAGAKEVNEKDMEDAIKQGMKEMKPVIDLIKKMQKELNVVVEKKEIKKQELDETTAKAFSLAKAWLDQNIKGILFDKTYYTKNERKAAVKVIKEKLDEHLLAEGVEKDLAKKVIFELAEKMIEAEVTRAILDEKKRVDGRKLDEIRELSSEVGTVPHTHGNGLFSRGETQVMSFVTLGAASLRQSLEGLEGEGTKSYMHHYNFPSYCVGEARASRGLGRRDIGHGALAEKALLPVIPSKEDFPYTIRVVSETLGSNGSSSMGSTCGSTLALMDAGVPIKKPVAGIAMGLASNKDMSKWEVLTDIQDLEDGDGGMDFKITGTKDGITAIQLDTKTDGLTEEIINKTLTQGNKARLQILDVITKAIPEPRKELSKYAPKITSFNINPEKIREVIGQGGKVINEIIDVCGVSIDIEDTGLVMVSGVDPENTAKAIKWVKDIARDFEAGEVFTGTVVRMLDFGIFVELLPGRDGMVHVSELAPYRISRPEDFVKEGDQVTVKIKEIDEKGRVNLTMKGLKENEPLWKDEKGKDTGGSFGSAFGGGFNRNNDRGNGGGRSRFGGRRPNHSRDRR
ncbi:MAG: polyribonucleotide nucleotidyltransferase [bacterium]